MWREPYGVAMNGKRISLKALAEAFGVCYDSCLHRWHRGFRDPWELLYGEGAKPIKITLTDEQLEWLQETKYARSGQTFSKGKNGVCRDDEWTIACDLIGVPRVFAEEVKEALCSRF